MSSLRTYNVTNIEDKELEEPISKISTGYSFVFIEDKNKYLLITGKKDLFKSFKSNLKSNFTDLVDTYLFDLETNKITLLQAKGKIPKATSFQKCININEFVYCYGGIVISQKGEVNTLNELNSFNLTTNEWSSKTFKEAFPNDRFDFTFNKIITIGLLYGGLSMPKEKYNDDLWIFNSKEQNWILAETTVIIVKLNNRAIDLVN